MRIALDTNVLAYAEGVNGQRMKKSALELVSALPAMSVVLPVQVCGELYHVLTRKANRSPVDARAAILSWRDAFAVVDTSAATMLSAIDLATNHAPGLWDAVILCAAAEAGCSLLLSEDMQHGFVWQGVTVVNPFQRPRHRALTALLESQD